MHVSPAFRQLHFFEQVDTALQPHLTSSLLPTAAAGSGVQIRRHPVSAQRIIQDSVQLRCATGFSPNTGLMQASIYMLNQYALSWRKLFYHLHCFGEHLLSKVFNLDM